MSEVVRDAVRRLQEEEAIKSARTRLTGFETGLTKGERKPPAVRRPDEIQLHPCPLSRRNLQEVSEYWMVQASEDVALRIVAEIVETIITISSQPRVDAPA